MRNSTKLATKELINLTKPLKPIQLGHLDENNAQPYRVFSIDGVTPTILAQQGGGRRPGGLYAIPTDFHSTYQPRDNNVFTYVSLFSGIGGFEFGLNKVGGKCVMASEIDKYATKAYTILHGQVPSGDVCQIKAEDVPDHSLLVGGFTCQPFSIAGKREGFEAATGTLFFEFVRIANVKRPQVIFLENVKGIINHDEGDTLNVIIKALCDIGYMVDFELLNSKYFGSAQNRDRIYIIAVRDDLITPEPWSTGRRMDLAAKGKQRTGQLPGIKTFNFDWPAQMETTVQLRDILEHPVDERYYQADEKAQALLGDGYRVRKLTPRETYRLQTFSEETYERLVAAGFSESQLYRLAGRSVTVNVIEAIGRKLVPLLTGGGSHDLAV